MKEPNVGWATLPPASFDQRWDPLVFPRPSPPLPPPENVIVPGQPAPRPPWGSGGRITQATDPMVAALRGQRMALNSWQPSPSLVPPLVPDHDVIRHILFDGRIFPSGLKKEDVVRQKYENK